MDGAVGEHGERVVDVVGALGEADERDDPLGAGRQLPQRLLRGLQEVLLQQQVLGRVARQRELGEEDQLGAGLARPRDVLADAPDVALEVADARVDLGERQRERGQAAGHYGAATGAACSWGSGVAATPATSASSAIEASSAAAMSSSSGSAS